MVLSWGWEVVRARRHWLSHGHLMSRGSRHVGNILNCTTKNYPVQNAKEEKPYARPSFMSLPTFSYSSFKTWLKSYCLWKYSWNTHLVLLGFTSSVVSYHPVDPPSPLILQLLFSWSSFLPYRETQDYNLWTLSDAQQTYTDYTNE